jgi:hypothetical protein
MEKKGRPSLFSETHQKIAFAMARLGATDKQIVEEIGITEQTLNNWKKKHIAFFESLKTAKQSADEKVEKSLYKLATGYKYTAQKPMVVSVGNNMGSSIEIAEYTESVQPNSTACIFWLKNRKPSEWRDKQEIQHSGGIAVSITPLDESL